MDVRHGNDTTFSFFLATPVAFLYVPAVLSIVADLYVSFVIIKYEKLRKEVANILLLHVNIVEMLFLFSITISIKVFAKLGLDITGTVPCVTSEVETALVLCLFCLLTLLTTDWYIKTYSSEQNHNQFRRVYNYFVAAIYVLTVTVACVASHHFCIHSRRFYASTMKIVIGFSLVVVAFAIGMNVVHMVRRSTDRSVTVQDNIGLATINIFLLAWMTVYLAVLSIIFGQHAGLVMVVLLVFMAAATCLAIPIFRLIYLCQCDKFKVFLDKAFSCECNDCRNETPRDDASVAYTQGNTSGVLMPDRRTAV